jgi:hypothetical protein
LISIRIRLLLFRLFGTDPDPDPCRFKEVMYLKLYWSSLWIRILDNRERIPDPDPDK